jgi:hypothetical protein
VLEGALQYLSQNGAAILNNDDRSAEETKKAAGKMADTNN